MERNILNKLISWKESKDRKPLVLNGARQVGKSWIIENDFAKTFKNGIAKVDFSYQKDFCKIFELDKDPKRILENISIAIGKKIDNNTLIFFDEIQACPDALTSLKYFCEQAKEYCVVAAGSLLGLASSDFPVGKVNFLNLFPMSFVEFLNANSDKKLISAFESINEIQNLPEIIHNQALEKTKLYLLIGGMPEVVKNWITFNDIKKVDQCEIEILNSYSNDFTKHADKFAAPKIWHIWNSLPSQLSKENKKFIYSAIKHGARAREYENALEWLCKANLIYKISNISKPGLPLSKYEDLTSFKIYSGDVGLLRQQSALSYEMYIKGNDLFAEAKGGFTENLVLNNIFPDFSNGYQRIYYWSQDNNAEVDFVIQYRDLIIPIEVKSGYEKKKKGLKVYMEKFNPAFAIRISANNLKLDGKILNIPFYLVNYLPKLIDLCLTKISKNNSK